MKQINFRIGNIELRTTKYHKVILEIVQWGENHCWTIASWHCRNSEGRHHLEFVGDRPFEERVNTLDFMHLARVGQIFLDELEQDDDYD